MEPSLRYINVKTDLLIPLYTWVAEELTPTGSTASLAIVYQEAVYRRNVSSLLCTSLTPEMDCLDYRVAPLNILKCVYSIVSKYLRFVTELMRAKMW